MLSNGTKQACCRIKKRQKTALNGLHLNNGCHHGCDWQHPAKDTPPVNGCRWWPPNDLNSVIDPFFQLELSAVAAAAAAD